jgi:tetratricopeptide (TPR) repeat protein/membrane protease YdiL (CAAX protease family)
METASRTGISSRKETLDSTNPADSPTRPASIYFTTVLGLAVGFSILLKPLWDLLESILKWAVASQYGRWSLTTSAYQLIATAVIFGIVVGLERKPLSSIGLKWPTLSDVGLGLGLFVAVLIAEGVARIFFWFFFRNGMSNVASSQMNSFMRIPVGLAVFGAAAGSFSEEVAARGFAIDRIRIVTGRLGLAAAVALVLDLAEHVPFWGWRYAILIAPMQLLFVLMYLWRRDIMACIIGHFLVDAMPSLMPFAAIGATSLLGYGGTYQMLAQRDFGLGDYAGAIAEYTLALKSQPDDPALLKARASVEVWNRDYVDAIGDLDKALSQDPMNPDPAMVIARANAYYYAGNYDQAQTDADQAVALSPKDSEVYSERGYIDDMRLKQDETISDLLQAIKYSGQKDEGLYFRLGYAYQEKSDYDQAIEQYNLAAKLNDSDARIFKQRAEALTSKKNPDYVLALDDYNRALAITPDDWETVNNTSWLLSTCPDAKIRDRGRALTLGKRACDLTSWKNCYPIGTMAAALAETGDFTQAVAWEQPAIKLMASQAATADELKDERARLELYRQGKPYREESFKK